MQILSANVVRNIPKLEIKDRINNLEYLSALFFQLQSEGQNSVVYTTLRGEYLSDGTRVRLKDLGYTITDIGTNCVSNCKIYDISWSEADAA
jgi:hypothetical protein